MTAFGRALCLGVLFAGESCWASCGPLVPSAKPCERQYIWPEGRIPDVQDFRISAKTVETGGPKSVAGDFCRPYIEWYAPNPATGRVDLCVLFVSGVGFDSCDGAGGMQSAIDRFVQEGITVARLACRMPRPTDSLVDQPGWADVQRAVRVIRSQAAKRGFSSSKIAAAGFSAGARLVLLLATRSEMRAYEPLDEIDDWPCHLLFALPQALDMTPLLEFGFDARTCPMCIFQGNEDTSSPEGALWIHRQLRSMKIPVELHLQAGRVQNIRGDGNRDADGVDWDVWFSRAREFIRQMNYDGQLGDEVMLMDRFSTNEARALYEKQPIWPIGRIPNAQTNQCQPYLEWHTPKKLKTRAVQIIYSGGSYTGNGPDGFEVAPARRYLNDRGMTVVTIKYRVPRPLDGLAKHMTAWQDLQRVIRIVRSQAKSRGLDPARIGIMGSSAGGHLTLMGATSSRCQSYPPIDDLDRISCGVQWAIAIYPAYALDRESRIVPEFSFDPDTCPMLFVHGEVDSTMDSVLCWERLRQMGIRCDLHTLATRRHCFQKSAAPGTGSFSWLDRIWEFLNADKGRWGNDFVQQLNDGWTADGVPVRLPHCWNVEDGTDGPTDLKCWNHDSVSGTGYARKKVVYRRELPLSGKKRYLRINAASIHAVVRVDGCEVARHAGAFTAFTVELPPCGKVVEIEVDNCFDPDVPPACGDFTMYGGLYRGVDLLEEPEVFDEPTDLPKYEFREDGFYVNGKKTFLKGVCYHQDREGKGWAISPEDEEEDVRLIRAMGANAIRTSHYPRSEHFYDLCDKYGIYVWTEIPLVDVTTASAAFRSNTLEVAREMVLQHRHHKCIAMWGIFNELYLKKMPDGQAEPLVQEVKDLIRSLDSRPIVAASNNPRRKELNAIPDALGFNMYPGWYDGKSTDLAAEIERWRVANGRSCVAVSEYGAGGSIGQLMPASDYRPSPGGRCHPVEYQLRHHQESWTAIKSNPHVWGSFAWVMFDVGSDNRHEGARDGLNDKGLVGFDHRTIKPAYEFYRREWSHADTAEP